MTSIESFLASSDLPLAVYDDNDQENLIIPPQNRLYNSHLLPPTTTYTPLFVPSHHLHPAYTPHLDPASLFYAYQQPYATSVPLLVSQTCPSTPGSPIPDSPLPSPSPLLLNETLETLVVDAPKDGGDLLHLFLPTPVAPVEVKVERIEPKTTAGKKVEKKRFPCPICQHSFTRKFNLQELFSGLAPDGF
ncbi:hypothetical protein HK104_009817 [Borealophlyctis nickersoniae]|nr:hypothetical protein HK104_009817 [Borealophlyctis nickersoniae]